MNGNTYEMYNKNNNIKLNKNEDKKENLKAIQVNKRICFFVISFSRLNHF